MADLAALKRDYRTAFLRYLPRHDEVPLTQAYELGRRAIASRVSLLDILVIHHAVLAETLQETPAETADILAAASTFLAEALAPYDMAQRALADLR